MTPPDHDSRHDSAGRSWNSPFLRPDPAYEQPDPPMPPGARRALALVIALATVAAGWGLRARLGFGPTREVSLATATRADARGGELAAAPARGDSARAAVAGGRAAAPAAAQSAEDSAEAALLLDPRRLVGAWHHGDSRSQYGDSLVLELRADGEALSAERRYTLDRKGWHVARAVRTGGWSVRFRAARPPQLCTSWRTPEAVEACETVELLDDSIDGRLLLRFAGRHWTLARPLVQPTAGPARRGK